MSWDEALSALGANEAWEPPPDLGPLPAELVARARETLDRLAEQIEALQARRDEVGRELAALPVASGEPSTPHYVDTTA
jgi:hypothetical protein